MKAYGFRICFNKEMLTIQKLRKCEIGRLTSHTATFRQITHHFYGEERDRDRHQKLELAKSHMVTQLSV